MGKIQNLTTQLVIEGVKKVISNAEALIADSRLLNENGRIPRSYALAQLAFEEIAKVVVLLRVAISVKIGEPIDYNYLNQTFVNHKEKTRGALASLILVLGHAIENGRDFKSLINYLVKRYENVNNYNDLKNMSLYVSYYKEKFVEPSQVISSSITLDLIFWAEIALKANRDLADVIFKDLDELAEIFKKY